MLDKKDLEEIIGELATENNIFSKEAQFQFEFAWKIKEKYNSYDVILEYLWKPEENTEEEHKKGYIDIVLFSDKEKKCVPIELKYKTTDKEITYKTNNGEYYTFKQGAPDTGSYDYIKDIYRIENLGEELYYKGTNYKNECGYAIIITNDSHYYNSLKEKNRNGKYYYWKNFSLAQNIIQGDITWIDPEDGEIDEQGKHTTEERMHKISLKNKYFLKDNWTKYDVPYNFYEPQMKNEPEFWYLITQISTKEK